MDYISYPTILSLVLLLCTFAIFTYLVINRVIFVSKHPTLATLLRIINCRNYMIGPLLILVLVSMIIVEVTALTCRINKNNNTYRLSSSSYHPAGKQKVERVITQYRTRNTWVFIIRPTNEQIWHKAVFKMGPVAGPKSTHVRHY